MLFFGHSVGGKPSDHPILDFGTAMLTGLAAVLTAFSPLLLFWLEKKKEKSLGWRRGLATLLELSVILLSIYLFARLVYLLASAIFVALCGFVLSSSVLIVAVAYAYKTFKDIELRESDIKWREKRFQDAQKSTNP